MKEAKPERIYYDYERQTWVRNDRYERCGHPEGMKCHCYGRRHQGERVVPQQARAPIASDGSIAMMDID